MNKKIKLLVTLLLIAGAAATFNLVPSSAMMEKTLPEQELNSVQTIANILSFAKSTRGQRVWPGFQLAESPVVLWFDNGHVYALNMKGKRGWKSIILPLGTQVLFSSVDRWGVTNVQMNPEFEVEGQKAYVFHMDLIKGDPFLPFFVFVHERFHPYQEANFEETPPGEYKDHLNAENLALMHLEGELLVEFLQSSDAEDKLEILKDFVAVHKERLNQLDEESRLWENHQQSIEGLADYVGLRTMERTGMRMFAQMHLLMTMRSHVEDPNITELSIKRRHYGVGATLAYALDYLHVKGWKKQVQNGKALDDLLVEALGLTDVDTTQRLADVKKEFKYSDLKDDIVAEAKEYSEEIAFLLNDYRSQKGLTLRIAKPKDNPVSGGGMDKRMLYLADGSILSVENQSDSSTADRKWTMTLDVPYVFQDKDGVHEFKVDKDSKISIDNEPYLVGQLLTQEDKEIPFDSLTWEGQNGKFTAKCPGVLKTEQGKVCISFDRKS